MPSYPVSAYLSIAVLGILVGVQYNWQELVNSVVPEPYLDEVFHVPQAQAYWQGRWKQWDPKITTPPGLYLFSWIIGKSRELVTGHFDASTAWLRSNNFIILQLLTITLVLWSVATKRQASNETVLRRELVITMFPLLFFFSGLYYTDLLSTLSVMLSYMFWAVGARSRGQTQSRLQSLHFVMGGFSMLTRQTNVFWVAIFLGGLQIIETIKKAKPKQVHDSPMSEAFFEDFPITSISLLEQVRGEDLILQLFFDLWPQVALLALFTGFVLGNNGVVMGDRSNHVATLHLPQMLYVWPAIVFFSWPALLPFLIELFTNKVNKLSLRARFPRTATIICFAGVFAAAVHFNTVVHPFTLADNRHYTFYVFRILLIIKWIAIPIYLICGWLCVSALGTPKHAVKLPDETQTHVSWVLVYLISTTLSLITAPLVEPRYFIIPWLIWRLHLPEVLDRAPEKAKADDDAVAEQESVLERTAHLAARYSTWIELFWYIVINAAIGYMFLYRVFEWKQEPGKVQRFMW